MELKEQIIDDIKNNPVILYMKGTKDMPMCGFSNSVVQILNHYGIDYKDINILEDPNIRIKLSEHSNWPTIPQLFVNGPQDYITILEWGYDDGGGTLRYPYTNPHTMNLETCEFEDVKDNYVKEHFNHERLTSPDDNNC